MLKRLLLSAVALGAISGLARAADVAVPEPVTDWTGFYIGVEAGASWFDGDTSASSVAGPCDPASGGGCSLSPNYSSLSAEAATFSVDLGSTDFMGGAAIGYDWQADSIVLGLEADIQAIAGSGDSESFDTTISTINYPTFPLQQTASVSSEIDYLATLRARLGVLVSPDWLLYATGGLAFGGIDSSVRIDQTCDGCSWTSPPGTRGSNSDTEFGWTAGLGTEYKFTENWSLKAEWLYYDLGSVSYNLPTLEGYNPPPPANNGALFMSSNTKVDTDFSGHLFSVGVNFRF